MIERPYASYSIDQLEALASTTDVKVLRGIHAEVSTYRKKTARVRRLTQEVEVRLPQEQSTDTPPLASQWDLFGQEADEQEQDDLEQHSPGPGHFSPTPLEFKPTPEQEAAKEAFLAGGSLKITAFAGAGKTSTLRLLASSTTSRGLYFAFNKAIVAEANGKFPENVHCATQHAYARRSFGGSYSPTKLTSKLSPKRLCADLGLPSFELADGIKLNGDQQAFLILATIRTFCNSADLEIADHHVPDKGRMLFLKEDQKSALRQWVVDQSRSLWQRMQTSRDPIPLGFNGYLKLWSLRRPRLPYNFVLLDEAQDTNPVVLSVLSQQEAQIVYVGDAHQQIYEWRGAINAMENMATEHTRYLTQSFRFGPMIADYASKILEGLGERQSLRGNDSVNSFVAPDGTTQTVLTRTNSMVIAEVLNAIEAGVSPHIVGGADEIKQMVGDVFSLKKGEPANHPDFFGFLDWDEVVAFSQTDEGEDLVRFVQLVERYGERQLWFAVKNTEPLEGEADVCISTAHKAKGREWDSVRIAEDFAVKVEEDGAIDPAEARLFYVSITRAKKGLVVADELLSAYCNPGNYVRR